MTDRILNFVASQAAWFACVLGAAHGWPWLGPACVAGLAIWHVRTRPTAAERAREARLLVSAGLIGYAADSALVLAGLLSFPTHAALGWPSSVWMAALWVAFAATLNASNSWMSGRYGAAAVFGAAGAPLAYAAGARLGAATLGGEPGWALLAVALLWGAAMPFLVWLAGRGPVRVLGQPVQPLPS